MKKLLEYDPITRTSTFFESDGSGKFKICQQQDISEVLKYTKALANDTSYKRNGIKTDWYHFATVPNSILHEILVKYNLNWQDKEDLPKIEKVLQRDYKALLTVDRI